MYFFKSFFSVATKISTLPNHTSWCWKGHISLLAFTILHIVFVARLLSLLQIVKFIYRIFQKVINKSISIDKASKRINVPAYIVEVYFIVWCIFLFCCPKDILVIKYFSCYFLFESFFWLLYYFFFRRFFEEKYAIMHSLEYIVILPLLIICQTRCISILQPLSFSSAMATLFFPNKDNEIYVIILSVFYTALIFGIFLSNLPIEQVKEKGNYRFNFSIIGNGEIVKGRLKKAIGNVEPANNVAVFDNKKNSLKNEREGFATFHYFITSDDNLKNIHLSNILWIATPPHTHFEYLNKFINSIFIAIEKPLVTNEKELYEIKRLKNSPLWNRVFCLSYYYLEKALPLTYLYHPNTFYEEYLEFHGMEREKILSLFQQVGQLKHIELILNEGSDPRDWVDSKEHGGHIFETFLHLAVLARMITGSDKEWNVTRWEIKNENGHYMSSIRCTGNTTINNTSFDLRMRKFAPQQLRIGQLTFQNGIIDIDLEGQEIALYFFEKGKDTVIISTKKHYSDPKYSIQLHMVQRCFDEGINPSLIDGSDLQIETLSWLFSQKHNWVPLDVQV